MHSTALGKPSHSDKASTLTLLLLHQLLLLLLLLLRFWRTCADAAEHDAEEA
jgi:hypothetical protein